MSGTMGRYGKYSGSAHKDTSKTVKAPQISVPIYRIGEKAEKTVLSII